MSNSYTYNQTQTFTATHAKHLAAKVATDLKRMQRFYDLPKDSNIDDFELEIISLLKAGFLEEVTYGFKKGDQWIEPTLRYTAKDLADSGIDDDPGKVRPGADVNDASFYSFLTYSSAYHKATDAERNSFKTQLPFQRGYANTPGVNGYFSDDRSYSSGGKGLNRSSLKGY